MSSRIRKWWIGGGLLMASVGASLSAAAPDPHKPRPKNVSLDGVAKYRKWTLANRKPYFVPDYVALLCSSAAAAKARQNPSPHGKKFIRVFVNGVGRDALRGVDGKTFPEGTLIVKEKLPTEKSTSPELLTVMLKRAKGYDRGHGDWEYAVFDGTGKKLQERGRLQNCRSCHAQQSAQDFVFKTYLTHSDRNAYDTLTAGAGLAARR
jgi:hypothetical protein